MRLKDGDVAQSVEQRTENPCVDGSIPPITTGEEREREGERERRVNSVPSSFTFCFSFLF